MDFCVCTYDIFFVSNCSLLVPGFQGCLAVRVLRFLLGIPVTNTKQCHGKYFAIRIYCLLPLLHSLCFPLNLEPRQFLECPVRRERKTVKGGDLFFFWFLKAPPSLQSAMNFLWTQPGTLFSPVSRLLKEMYVVFFQINPLFLKHIFFSCLTKEYRRLS